MDEHKLADAFRAAARETPPASFDAADVVAASHRVTARRRRQVAGGSALAVVLLAGGVVLGNSVLRGGNGATPLAGGPPSVSGNSRVFTEHGQPNSGLARGATPPGADTRAGTAAPLTGEAERGCGPADRELAAALASELPAAAGAMPSPAAGPCPAGARAVAVAIRGGALTVVLAPAPNAGRAGPTAGVASVLGTRSGGTLTVASGPAAGSATAPYAEELDRIAADLAAHF